MHISTYHIYSIVSCGFLSFVLTISRALHFLFLYLMERFGKCSVFPWLRFFNITLFSHPILFSIMCTSITGGNMMNRRQL